MNTYVYLHDAMGSKLRKTATKNGTTAVSDDIGVIEYSKVGTATATIDRIATAEVRLTNRGGNSVFVSTHAMKHLEELTTNGAKFGPNYLKLLGQTYQKALHSSIDDVLSRGTLQYRKMYYSGGNEIMFAPPRAAGELPAVIHFR